MSFPIIHTEMSVIRHWHQKQQDWEDDIRLKDGREDSRTLINLIILFIDSLPVTKKSAYLWVTKMNKMYSLP